MYAYMQFIPLLFRHYKRNKPFTQNKKEKNLIYSLVQIKATILIKT